MIKSVIYAWTINVIMQSNVILDVSKNTQIMPIAVWSAYCQK